LEIIKPRYRIVRPDTTEMGIQELKYIEREARRCYKTEEKITEDSYIKFVRMLCDKKHSAMLGFGELHVELVCDRGVTHEMVRHRLCEFAQESTRYCDYGGSGIQVVCPDDILNDPESFERFKTERIANEEEYKFYISRGHKPQIARCCLPTCTKTEIGWKANFQEWRHIFSQRAAKAAHPQMQELMIPLLADIQRLIPVVFDDLGA
jgi:thymidylate synthase (FAD)